MSYRLTDHEPVPDDLKRIIVEQIDTALDHLASTRGNQDDVLHDARVCLKKIRAVLRLVQADIPGDIFRQAHVCYRDAGRRRSAVCDPAAMVETFDKLTDRCADQLAADGFTELRQAVRPSSTARRPEKKNARFEVANTIRAARARVARWPLHHHGFAAVHQGLKRVYKQGRRRFATACDQPSIENFHQWRRPVKCLRSHIRLFKPIWAPMMDRFADELKRLGAYLSDDHDLTMLRQRVLEQTEQANGRRDREAWVVLIEQRRGELQVEARRLGARVHVEQPRAFTARLKVDWQAWRAERHVNPIAVS